MAEVQAVVASIVSAVLETFLRPTNPQFSALHLQEDAAGAGYTLSFIVCVVHPTLMVTLSRTFACAASARTQKPLVGPERLERGVGCDCG